MGFNDHVSSDIEFSKKIRFLQAMTPPLIVLFTGQFFEDLSILVCKENPKKNHWPSRPVTREEKRKEELDGGRHR
jgi:hypothetical protein